MGNLFMLAGAISLLAFFAFKGWSANQGAAGLEAFEQARAAFPAEAITPRQPGAQAADKPLAAPVATAAEKAVQAQFPPDRDSTRTDTSSWSTQRLAAWREARQTDDAPPQAVLSIDHLDLRVPVFNGASDLNLNRGVARIIGTGRIGERGNLGIAGHRDGFFRPLKDIKLGDRLTLETFSGSAEFQVSSIEIVDPTDLHVLAPTDASMVTLVTCYPFYHVGNAPQRFIVKAEAIENQVNS